MNSTADPRPVGTAVPQPPAAGAGGAGGAPSGVRLLGAAAAGLLVAAFPPYGIWPLAILSVAAFALVTRGVRARRGPGLGLVYGLAFFVPLLSWTGIYVGPAPWLILAAAEAAFLAALGAGLAVTARLPGWPLWGAALLGGAGGGAATAGRSAASRGGGWRSARQSSPLPGSPRTAGRRWSPSPSRCAGACCAAARARPEPLRAAPGESRPVGRRTVLAAPARRRPLVGVLGGGAARWPGLADRPPTRPYTVAVVQGNVPRLGLDFNAQREAVLRQPRQRDAQAGRRRRRRPGRQARPGALAGERLRHRPVSEPGRRAR